MTNQNDQDNQTPDEPQFRKVDKRHSAAPDSAESPAEQTDDETSEAPADEQTDQPQETAEAGVGPDRESAPETVSLAELSIYDTLRFMTGLLIQQAWIHLGIQVAPGAEELTEDFPQARLAIDTLEFIVEKLDDHLEESERAELSTVLTNLRLNYVKKTK